jgi:hypothetical protein
VYGLLSPFFHLDFLMAQHRPAPVSTALADSLDIIKVEFDLLASEVAVARRERDECEATRAFRSLSRC